MSKRSRCHKEKIRRLTSLAKLGIKTFETMENITLRIGVIIGIAITINKGIPRTALRTIIKGSAYSTVS